MTGQLKRVTTEYINFEDRIRLNGLTPNGTVSVWLTQRLCNNLVKNLIAWLEKTMSEMPDILQHNMQSFAQQRAHCSQQQQAASEQPVRPDNEINKHKSWLAFSISLQTAPHAVRLIISDLAETESIEFSMEARQLRQWLNILYKGYSQANWPDDMWPSWMIASSENTLPNEQAVH
ncbi:hypothetical protein [Oceanospirillum sediminis]|uniref:Uncharacterized protein n=1 Tax=Oceanospirillum sediminis TaxID=2760088 RepID=A0A839ILD7_9GAMM|nr:hypothetical protein [Oceanospirillum sediminis]MBB1485309.1 hypothetical protein [Oceanospirillum sediminis]